MSGARRDLLAAAERAAERAQRSGLPAWVLWRRRTPGGEEPKADATLGADAFRFAQPARGFAIAATGAAAVAAAAGEQRFAGLRAEVARITESLECVDHAELPGTRPVWVGGFAFAPDVRPASGWEGFPPARLVLPEWLHLRERGASVEHRVVRIEPGDSAEEAWRTLLGGRIGRARRVSSGAAALVPDEVPRLAHVLRVRRALAAVRSGMLEKVVLAHARTVRGAGACRPHAVYEALARRHPDCTAFLAEGGGAAFVGASPEQLVRVTGAEVRADALAGSAPRGTTARRDAQWARELCESKKEQEEHAVVVRALRRALEPLCSDLVVPQAPRIRGLADLQHLHTPVTGRLRSDVPLPLLTLAERIHPTPAVAGAPRAAALAWLHDHEGLDRGWYAGGIGWMDLRGDGEFVVALRCALLRGSGARLFAGAGIVPGSDARAEVDETALKLRPLLAALEACA